MTLFLVQLKQKCQLETSGNERRNHFIVNKWAIRVSRENGNNMAALNLWRKRSY